MHDPVPSPARPSRSFVRREGRLTRGQSRALQLLSTRYCLSEFGGEKQLEPAAVFDRPAPLHLEIGCGTGETLLALANRHPECNYVGIEVYRPGVGYLLQRLEADGITNVRVLVQDAALALQRGIRSSTLDAVYIFFPDPWPKKRHQKRRLIQPAFVQDLQASLRPLASVYLATDDEGYAEQMMQVFEANGYRNDAGPGQYSPRPEWRPLTRFERRGLRLGHKVFDLTFVAPPLTSS